MGVESGMYIGEYIREKGQLLVSTTMFEKKEKGCAGKHIYPLTTSV